MDEAQRKQLLALARETMRAHLAGEPLPPLPDLKSDESAFGGAFVSLHNRGELRGCMGRFSPEGGPARVVQDMAVAVLSDPRFVHRPVTLRELPQLSIEISLLSPMKRTDNPLSLVVGRHGILVRRGGHSGCFLPQVAVEQGWDAVQFLSACCSGKARLPADAWRDPATEVYLFEAEVFSEPP